MNKVICFLRFNVMLHLTTVLVVVSVIKVYSQHKTDKIGEALFGDSQTCKDALTFSEIFGAGAQRHVLREVFSEASIRHILRKRTCDDTATNIQSANGRSLLIHSTIDICYDEAEVDNVYKRISVFIKEGVRIEELVTSSGFFVCAFSDKPKIRLVITDCIDEQGFQKIRLALLMSKKYDRVCGATCNRSYFDLK